MAQSPRHARPDAFARLVFQGVAPYKAYPLAGYAPNRGNPYRLLNENERVRQRLAQLQERAAMKAVETVETIAAQLDEARDLARSLDQPAAMTQAVTVKAKLLGLLVDRKESGAPGDFAALQSVEDVIGKVRQELGDDAAELVRRLISADEPAQLDPPEPTHQAGDTVN